MSERIRCFLNSGSLPPNAQGAPGKRIGTSKKVRSGPRASHSKGMLSKRVRRISTSNKGEVVEPVLEAAAAAAAAAAGPAMPSGDAVPAPSTPEGPKQSFLGKKRIRGKTPPSMAEKNIQRLSNADRWASTLDRANKLSLPVRHVEETRCAPERAHSAQILLPAITDNQPLWYIASANVAGVLVSSWYPFSEVAEDDAQVFERLFRCGGQRN